MLAIDRVLHSPELLEAGEYALLKRTLLSNGYLLDSLHQMPPNLVNEIGADKLDSWKKFCFQLDAILMAAYDRRARWKDVPNKKFGTFESLSDHEFGTGSWSVSVPAVDS